MCFGIRSIHFNPLKANRSEHRASRLKGKEDSHAERPVHPWVQFLLHRCTADADSGVDAHITLTLSRRGNLKTNSPSEILLIINDLRQELFTLNAIVLKPALLIVFLN